MTYTHPTPSELVMIEACFTEKFSDAKIAHSLVAPNRLSIMSSMTLCVRLLYAVQRKQTTIWEKSNRPSSRPTDLFSENGDSGLDIDGKRFGLTVQRRTLYRQFKQGLFDIKELPMKGKRHPNGLLRRNGNGF